MGLQKEQVISELLSFGFGLSTYNGNDKGELPLGATYVIDTNGIVTFAFLDADYRNRAEPIAVPNALTKTK